MSYNNASNSTCTNISNAATSRSSTKNKYRRKKLKRKLKKTSDLVIELFHRVEHLEALLVLNDKKAKTKFIISDEMKVYLHVISLFFLSIHIKKKNDINMLSCI